MISLPSCDDELLNSAYANINLIADKAWTFDTDEPFQKLNRSLWIQCCKLSAKYKDHGNSRRTYVHDIIPDSYLAKYGNYEYSDERERMYKPDSSTSAMTVANFYIGEATEPWMLADVEELFTRLTLGSTTRLIETSHLSQLLNDSNSAIKSTQVDKTVPQDEIERHYKSNWSNRLQTEQPLRERNFNANSKKQIGEPCESFLTRKNTNAEAENKHTGSNGYQKYNTYRYTIETQSELELYSRITCTQVRELWNNEKAQQKLENHSASSFQLCYQRQNVQQQQQTSANRRTRIEQYSLQNYMERQKEFYYSLQYHPLVIKDDCQVPDQPEVYSIMRKTLPPSLSAEVPEFFPKTSLTLYQRRKDRNVNNSVRYFPSSNETNYQNELFPYNKLQEETMYENTGLPLLSPSNRGTSLHPSHQWIPRGPHLSDIQFPFPSTSHPICTSIQSTNASAVSQEQLQAKATPIPVYQRPMELYHEDGQRRKSQGVDFNNLILLTNNAMKVHQNQSKNRQRASLAFERRQLNVKPGHGSVFQWLDKGRAKETKEFVTVNTLISEMQTFDKCDQHKIASSWKLTDTQATESTRIAVRSRNLANPIASESSPNRLTKKRLYRDVLTNASSRNVILENLFERRYDELEQQAVEQYRTSEESIALKYQELEQQAIEQYRSHSEVSDNRENMLQGATDEKVNDDGTQHHDIQNSFGGKRCPRPGQCIPLTSLQEKVGSKSDIAASSKRGTFLQPQISVLTPESRLNTSVTCRTMCQKNARPVIASKSLTTLAQKVIQGSKNVSKGASGDKINQTVQASQGRRLILMSPFIRDSETDLEKTTALKKISSLSHTDKNILNYYHKSELVQTGSGDKNVSIVQSPATKGICPRLVKKCLYNVNYISKFSFASLAVRFLNYLATLIYSRYEPTRRLHCSAGTKTILDMSQEPK